MKARRFRRGPSRSAALFQCEAANSSDTFLDPSRRARRYPMQRFKMGFEFVDQFDRAVWPFGFDLP